MRKLFQLVGEISIDGINLVNKQMRTMDKEARKVQRSIATLGKNMEKTGKAMTKYVTLPIVAAGAAVVKFGADFDKAMTSSLAIMGDVSNAMRKNMSDAAREVAKTTKFSATEAAEAYYFLASAGLDAAKSLKALPKVAAFAQAGQFDLSIATSLLTDAQSALGMKSKDATENMRNMVKVSDILIKATSLADASTLEFSEALSGPLAGALRANNRTIEEGVALLALLAERGQKGAEASKSASLLFRDIPRAFAKNRKDFEGLGLAIADVNDNMLPMATIIDNLTETLGKMSDVERAATLDTLGLTRGVADVIKKLLDGGDELREFEKKLSDVGGTTDEVSKKQLQNFWDQLGLIKSELIDIGLTIWQTLEPILTKKLIPALKKVTNIIKTAADRFDKLSVAQKDTIIMVVAVVAAVGPLLLILGKALIATKALTSAILLMNASLLANPFVLAAVAITAIGAAIYYTVAAWDEWKKSIADDIAEKQTSALKQNLEEIIPLYGELALMGTQPMGEKRFEEVSKKVKELETNLADLGAEIDFESGFGSKVVQAENALTDLELAISETGDTIDRTADKIEAETKAVDKSAMAAAKANRIKQEQIALSKSMIRQRISETNSLKAQEFQMLKLLKIEEEEALAKAEGGEKAKESIRKLYARKRIQLEKETAAKIQAIEDAALAKEKEREAKRLKLLETKKQKITRFFEEWAEEEAKFTQEQLEKFFTLVSTLNQITGQMSAIVSQYYYNKNAELDNSEQKEIKAVKKSLMNEEEKDEALAAIDEKYAKKRNKLKREQAKKDKAIAIFGAIINTAAAVVKTFADWGFPLGIVFAAIMGALGIAQIALIASEPLPMRRGAYVKGGHGGVQAEIGEGTDDEIVLPMKTGVQALAEALVNKLSEFKLPEMGAPKLAMAGGGTIATGASSRGGDTHLHIGTLIADESGLKELERRLGPYRIADQQRKGRAYYGGR